MESSGCSERRGYNCYAYPPSLLSRTNSLLGTATLLESLLPTIFILQPAFLRASAIYVPAYSLSKVFKWEKRWVAGING